MHDNFVMLKNVLLGARQLVFLHELVLSVFATFSSWFQSNTNTQEIQQMYRVYLIISATLELAGSYPRLHHCMAQLAYII